MPMGGPTPRLGGFLTCLMLPPGFGRNGGFLKQPIFRGKLHHDWECLRLAGFSMPGTSYLYLSIPLDTPWNSRGKAKHALAALPKVKTKKPPC